MFSEVMSTMEEKLIDAVRRKKLLYDTSHPDYKKNVLKSQVWDEVAEQIGMQSGCEAKLLWEKLRHSLRDALRRQKNKSGPAPVYMKLWKYQTKMGFLMPFMVNIKSGSDLIEGSNKETIVQNHEQLKCEDPQEAYIAKEPSIEEWEVECKTTTIQSGNTKEDTSKRLIEEIPSGFSCYLRESSPKPLKKSKKEEHFSILRKHPTENWEYRSPARESLVDRTQHPNDPLYYFFLSMYETTKRMPPSSQHVVKNHIYKAVTDMEATLLYIPQT